MIIREYRESDQKALIRLIEGLQDHQHALDRWGKIRKPTKGFGARYVTGLLEKTSKEEGVIFLAEIGGRVVGCVAGVIERVANDQPTSDCKPCVHGRILELFVEEGHRRKDVGSLLMKRIEKYFQSTDCDSLRVEAFGPNTASQNFYRRCGYEVWTVDFIKKVKA